MANTAPYVVKPIGSATFNETLGTYRYDASVNFSDANLSQGDKLTYSLVGVDEFTSIDPDTGIITGNLEAAFNANCLTCQNTFDPSVCGGNVACESFYQQERANCISLEVDALNAYLAGIFVVATDSSGLSVSLPFRFIQGDDNTNPIAANDVDAATTGLGGVASGNVLLNDTDADGDQLVAVAATKAGTYGTLDLSADGAYTYTASNLTGPEGVHLLDTFQYEIGDQNGGTATAILDITLNRGPVAARDTQEIAAGRSVTGNVLANDRDADGDTLTVTAIAGGTLAAPSRGQFGSLTLQSDGSYSYVAHVSKSPVGVVRQDVFTYAVSDGFGGTSTSTLNVTVLPTGNAIVIGTGSADVLIGGNGKNFLLGLAGDDLLKGKNGTDVLLGGAGNDVLKGGNGKDVLLGLAGNDTLVGGNGADTFVFSPNFGKDTIKDFRPGVDSIKIDRTVFGTWQEVKQHLSEAPGSRHAVLTTASGDSVTFENVRLSELLAHRGDFEFF